MARHATPASTHPFTHIGPARFTHPGTALAPLRLPRLLAAALLALLLAAAASNAVHPAAAAPGETGRTSVPNLAPGNAETDIDAFWREIFADAGIAYSPPVVVPFDAPVSSGCGYVTPAEVIAFYCAADVAVYWSTPSYAASAGGDAAWVNVMAHEWSHHAQTLIGTNTPWRRANDMVSLELEATCMGGVYVADARARDLVDDAMIATMVGMFVGSPFHGSTEQVQAAFLSGLDAGFSTCGVALPTPAVPVAAASDTGGAAGAGDAAKTADAGSNGTPTGDTVPEPAAGTPTRVTAAAVNLRATASVSAPIRTVLTPADRLEITGLARTSGGYTWYPVEDTATGKTGFVAAQFLAL